MRTAGEGTLVSAMLADTFAAFAAQIRTRPKGRASPPPYGCFTGPGRGVCRLDSCASGGPGRHRYPRAAPFPRPGGAGGCGRVTAEGYYVAWTHGAALRRGMICWRRTDPCSPGKMQGCGAPSALTHGSVGAASKPDPSAGSGWMRALPLSGQRTIWKCITCVGRARRRRSFDGLMIRYMGHGLVA